jgi:DNA polymerase III delta prime subunit
MPLPPIAGHLETRRRLAAAHRSGRLPQTLVFTGPTGVGKQRLALWLAQLMQCETPAAEPCGVCRSCRQVLGLQHADVHWLVPIPRPKAGDPDKQVEEAAESLAALMEERRTGPLYLPPDGMASHTVASARVLLRAASLTAVGRGPRVFIIGAAERLVPQESSPDAANALLKLLEEPPANSLFILTTPDARRLLTTIRSRAVPVRLGRLSDDEVKGFLAAEMKPPLSAPELDARVRRAGGSIGAALAGGDDNQAEEAARTLLEALLSGPGPRLERALRQQPWSARGEFSAVLDAVADTLGEAARGAMGEKVRRPVPASLLGSEPQALFRAMDRVSEAREAAYGNVNPQLLLAVLGDELAALLV